MLSAALRLSRRRPWLTGIAMIALVSVWAFVELAEELVTADSLTRTDSELAGWLHAVALTDGTPLALGLTTLGGATTLGLISLLACVLLLRCGRAADATLVAVAYAGAGILNWGLKALFARPRPSFADPLVSESGFSFPSGHSMMSIAVYGALAYVLARGTAFAGQLALLGAFGALTLAIGFTRLYLGAHYLTDVLAGFSAGFVWLAACVLVLALRRAPAPAVAVS